MRTTTARKVKPEITSLSRTELSASTNEYEKYQKEQQNEKQNRPGYQSSCAGTLLSVIGLRSESIADVEKSDAGFGKNKTNRHSYRRHAEDNQQCTGDLYKERTWNHEHQHWWRVSFTIGHLGYSEQRIQSPLVADATGKNREGQPLHRPGKFNRVGRSSKHHDARAIQLY